MGKTSWEEAMEGKKEELKLEIAALVVEISKEEKFKEVLFLSEMLGALAGRYRAMTENFIQKEEW